MTADETPVSMRFSHEQITVVLLAGILLCSLGIAVTAVGGSSTMGTDDTANAGVFQIEDDAFEADRTIFRITVLENGSAEWTFRYEQRLESETAVSDFESYAEQFNQEETDSYRNFRDRASELTVSGSEVTDREMTAESFDREARTEERAPAGETFAVVEMSFLWSNFAERDGDRLVVGDVFVDGLYVGPDQELRFERGPTVRFESVTPDPDSMAGGTLADSETVSWIGETQFTDRHPRVVSVDRNVEDDSTSAEPDADAAPVSEPETESTLLGGGRLLSIVVLTVVLLLGAGAVVAYRSDRQRRTTETKTTDSVGEPEITVEDDAAGDVALGSTPDMDADATDSTAAEISDDGDSEAISEITDAELLSDEDRVVALLESNGGRMKQIRIVEKTDWSKSKVSMLLSDMEAEETISKLRVGRENIISLAGHEPDAAGSPFDDE